MAEQHMTDFDQKLMADILLPGQSLTAFKIEMTGDVKKIFDIAEERQRKIMKLKEVDEALLSKVVKL